MEKISWKACAQIPVKAETAYKTICDLQRTLGKDNVTAKELLDASRADDAPLHNCFEWDDSIAAERYRVWQATHIINSIEITIVKEDNTPISTRGFVNVNIAPTKQGEFVAIDVAIKNPTYRAQVLRNALNELRSFQRKYSTYTELTDVFKAVDAFAASLQ